jgi:uncharacterized membrane protein YccC
LSYRVNPKYLTIDVALQHPTSMPFIFLVIVGWIYVVLMMSLAEATHANGSVVGAVFTFLLYGVAPVALVTYIMLTPARKRAIRKREADEQAARDAASGQPGGGGETAADAVPPVRKEP